MRHGPLHFAGWATNTHHGDSISDPSEPGSIETLQMNHEQPAETVRPAAHGADDRDIDKAPSSDLPGGVQRAEAVTLTWTKASLAFAYIFMWSIYCVNAFQASITSNLTAYVLSGFQSHSLIPVISVVSNIMSGILYLPIAKTLDIWGRSEGFLIMASIATLGLILMATCHSVTTYAAAQGFYSVGFAGMIYCVDVITSDTSTLRSRGLAYAFTASPYIISAFAGPTAAQSFYEQISWRWAFGCFAIILPFVAIPLYITLQLNQRKAKRHGVMDEERGSRTPLQSLWHYVIEFDALGVFVLAAGLTLFLLPFSLAVSTTHSWASPSVISMLVIGSALLIAFGFIERSLAPKPFIPCRLLVSHTLLATCLLNAIWQVAYNCWNSYFYSYLQVVNELTIAQAGYVGGVFAVISGCWLFLVGFLIRYTGRFKWLLLCAVPLYALGVGLMIHFRHPHTKIGYIIMCQVFIAVGGSTLGLCQLIAVLAIAEHGDVAAVLAMLGLFGYMGGAVGNSISGAIWTNTLPKALERLLPKTAQDDARAIFDDLSKQLSYPMGSPVRDAIIQAYALAQSRILLTGTLIMVLAFVCVLFIKNIKVSEIKQVNGTLF